MQQATIQQRATAKPWAGQLQKSGNFPRPLLPCLRPPPCATSITRRRPLAIRASSSSGVYGDGPSYAIRKSEGSDSPAPVRIYNGVSLLLFINCAVFILDHVFRAPVISTLYLNHAHWHWWQFLTSAFCHGSFQHLTSNLFLLLVFGKQVEETEGAGGLWLIYLLTALGGSLASFFFTPAIVHGAVTVSLGASGAVFGLFAVAVLSRLRFDLRLLLEGLILGNFVWQQLLTEARHQVTGGIVVGGMPVSHIAHIGGAVAGVLLVMLLSKVPEAPPKS